MARQVYFDPFGSRLAGYELGAQRQTNLEDATRKARREDAMFPLEHREALRRDDLGAYGMNAAYNAIDYGDRRNKNSVYRDEMDTALKYPAGLFGITAPAESLTHQQYNITPQMENTYNIPNQPLFSARQEYNNLANERLGQLEQLVASGQFQGDHIDAMQLIQSDVASEIARKYGVAPTDVITSEQRPDLQQTQQQGTGYFMPDGQGGMRRVGGMIDPNARILEQIRQPQVDARMKFLYELQQDAIRRQQDAIRADAYRRQTDINLYNATNPRSGANSMPDY